MNELGKSVKNILDMAAYRDNHLDTDYTDSEGYLVCGICNKRKQLEIELFGEKRRVPTLCICEEKERENERFKAKQEAMRIQREKLRAKGIADTEYLKWTFDVDDRQDPRISDALLRYTEKWESMYEQNMGILFYGNVGTGKTFYSACIANKLIDKNISVLMTNIPALISSMNKNFESEKTELLNRISKVPLLILDDLGIERDTGYSYEKLQEIIDTRYRSGKPLIVSTNLTLQQLSNPEDTRYKRVYDRVLSMCYPIEIKGLSRRREDIFKKGAIAKNLLGI